MTKNTKSKHSRPVSRLLLHRAKSKESSLLQRLSWAYLLTFAGFYIFSTCVYGDMLRRTAEANFITNDSTQMAFLTSQSWGTVYCWGRWLLCSMSNLYVAALLSLILTLTAVLADKALCIPRRWRGVSALVPAGRRVVDDLSRTEPLLQERAFAAVHHSGCRAPGRCPAGLGWPLLMGTKERRSYGRRCQGETRLGLDGSRGAHRRPFATALQWNKAEILTARMQMRMMDGDFEGMVDDAHDLERPTRSVAAYYAIGLVQTGQLLERQFDIPYDFPEMRLERHDGNEEYTIFTGDCSFYAGLINTAYRCAMDYMVLYGPSLYNLEAHGRLCHPQQRNGAGRKIYDHPQEGAISRGIH